MLKISVQDHDEQICILEAPLQLAIKNSDLFAMACEECTAEEDEIEFPLLGSIVTKDMMEKVIEYWHVVEKNPDAFEKPISHFLKEDIQDFIKSGVPLHKYLEGEGIPPCETEFIKDLEFMDTIRLEKVAIFLGCDRLEILASAWSAVLQCEDQSRSWILREEFAIQPAESKPNDYRHYGATLGKVVEH